MFMVRFLLFLWKTCNLYAGEGIAAFQLLCPLKQHFANPLRHGGWKYLDSVSSRNHCGETTKQNILHPHLRPTLTNHISLIDIVLLILLGIDATKLLESSSAVKGRLAVREIDVEGQPDRRSTHSEV